MPTIDESQLDPVEKMQFDSFRTMVGVMPTPAIRLLRAYLAQEIKDRGEALDADE